MGRGAKLLSGACCAKSRTWGSSRGTGALQGGLASRALSVGQEGTVSPRGLQRARQDPPGEWGPSHKEKEDVWQGRRIRLLDSGRRQLRTERGGESR